jgi:hypothetical protein
MNRTRIALLGIFAVLVAVWVSSATLPPATIPTTAPVPIAKASRNARPGHQRAQGTRPRDVTTFDLNDAAERLRTRLSAAKQTRTPGRNPFEFPRVAPAVPVAAVTAAAAPVPTMPIGPLPPPFDLTGVAEKKNGDVLERTAILSGNNQIYFAKAGERLLGRYEVTAVGADAVELREIEGGRLIRLGLK